MGIQESPPLTISSDVQSEFVELTQTSLDIDCNDPEESRRPKSEIYLNSRTMVSKNNKILSNKSNRGSVALEGKFHKWQAIVPEPP
jgi:hypothetical protein